MRQIQKRKKDKHRIDLRSLDIRSVLDEVHIEFTERGKNVSEGWIGVSCPFCNDHSNHLGINLETKVISCFSCGETGNILRYLSEELGSFGKALEISNKHSSYEIKNYDSPERHHALKVDLPKTASSKITPYHSYYIKKRKFDPAELEKLYNLHYCGPDGGKWKNRIIVPVTRNRRLITFTSVDISEETQIRYRHLSLEESVIHVKETLYGLDDTDGRSVIVVEGLFDKYRIGFGCVTTFGTKITKEQIRLLAKFENVTALMDGDDAGRQATERLANELTPFCNFQAINLEEGVDPDDLSNSNIKKIKRIAKVHDIW